MILDFGKYQIVTDDRQFVVKERKVVKESEKAENVGNEYLETQGYYTHLEAALKSLGRRVVLENDDIQDIMKELRRLEKQIKEFVKLFELEV